MTKTMLGLFADLFVARTGKALHPETMAAMPARINFCAGSATTDAPRPIALTLPSLRALPSMNSSENFAHDVAVNIRQPILPPLELIGEPFVIKAQQMKDCCLQIVNVDRAFKVFVA